MTHPRPRESLDRCALRAQLRGDQLLGTAFPAARVLLVEQPGAWGHGGLTESHFDPATAQALIAAGRARRHPGARRPPARTHAARCPPHLGLGRLPRRVTRRSAGGRIDRDAELLDLPLDGTAGVPDSRPYFLICAHSKHDTCCALRGRPVAAALHDERPGQVWECSHVGGERFAANVLVLPHGLLYGRVLPFAAPEFMAAAERGEVIGALLRGRIGLPPVAQAALAYAYDHLALRSAMR